MFELQQNIVKIALISQIWKN